MKYSPEPEPEPNDEDLPGDWVGGVVFETSRGFSRLFVNRTRTLCIHYEFPGGRILLEQIRKVEGNSSSYSWERVNKLLY